MPFFSFIIKNKSTLNKILKETNIIEDLEINSKYYSKNTDLWKIFNNACYNDRSLRCNLEKRQKAEKINKSILFCLPPRIGLGDSIEYALAINAIIKSKKFNKVGVAFVDRYKEIFVKYFKIHEVYENIISEKTFIEFDTIFHFTLEIKELKNQKYDREDIESVILKYFQLSVVRSSFFNKNILSKKITIFPISKSPLRSMSINLLNFLITELSKFQKVEIVLDNNSNISNHIEKKMILNHNTIILQPKNLKNLLNFIENISYGVFIDSGPLHAAKILNKKGCLITTSVGAKKLINGYNNIDIYYNNFESDYCKSPCGLVNIFNYKNKVGCYDSLSITKEKILTLKNYNILQRGPLKQNYIKFIDKPVNCIQNINKVEVLAIIKKGIKNL